MNIKWNHFVTQTSSSSIYLRDFLQIVLQNKICLLNPKLRSSFPFSFFFISYDFIPYKNEFVFLLHSFVYWTPFWLILIIFYYLVYLPRKLINFLFLVIWNQRKIRKITNYFFLFYDFFFSQSLKFECFKIILLSDFLDAPSHHFPFLLFPIK